MNEEPENGAEGGGKDIVSLPGDTPAASAPAPPILEPAPAKPFRLGPFTLYQVITIGVACAMLVGLYLGMQPIIECSNLQAEYNAGNVSGAFSGYERVSGIQGYAGPNFDGILTGTVAE